MPLTWRVPRRRRGSSARAGPRRAPAPAENLEPKATLRAIVADGRWAVFRAAYLKHREEQFADKLAQRLDETLVKGVLDPMAVAPLREELARAEQARKPEENRKAA